MDDIILAIIMKEGVINTKELVRKSGFTENDVKTILFRLISRGKISLSLADSKVRNKCAKCPLNKICHFNKGGVRIGIDRKSPGLSLRNLH
jgi:CRISPR/Cas system type I-B associated protein Csh2 (Cas7 group RAMP superfamily)